MSNFEYHPRDAARKIAEIVSQNLSADDGNTNGTTSVHKLESPILTNKILGLTLEEIELYADEVHNSFVRGIAHSKHQGAKAIKVDSDISIQDGKAIMLKFSLTYEAAPEVVEQ